MTPDPAPTPSRATGTITYADLAHAVIARIAPQELELLPSVTAAEEARAPGRTGTAGGSIGLGLDPEVVTLVVYPVLAGSLSTVAGSAGVSGARRLWRRLRRSRAPRPSDRTPVVAPEQLEAVRRACRDHAAAAGMSARKAALLADAVVGALAQPLPGTDPDRPA